LGGPGVVVTLRGTNFSGTTAVSFGGVTASFTVASDTVITARIASGGGSGMVKVTAATGADSLGGFYFSTKVPVITGVFPYTGPVGTVVTIKGGNFDPVPSRDTVFFGGVKAYVSSATVNYLTVSVPVGAVYAPISVTANGLTTYSNSFIPVYTGGGNIDTNSFGPPARYAIGLYPYTVTTADFDGDGRSDLAGVVVNANQVAVLRNNSQSGSIYFGSPDTFATGASPFYIATADFNGDGKPDIVVSNQGSDSLAVLQNSGVPGTISFAAKFGLATYSSPRNLATADLDGDGMADIVTIDGGDSVALFLNTTPVYGAMSFRARLDLGAGAGPVGIALGDLDGDGRPDMVVCDSLTNQFLVFRNTSVPGAISFAAPATYPAGAGPAGVAIADLDGDGKPEVIISHSGGNLFAFRNTSSLSAISFASPVTFNTGSGVSAISISDVNGDGKPDITLAGGSSNGALVLQNKSTSGGIVFAPFVLFPAGGSPAGIVAGDFDGDGRPDMALADYSGTPSASISVLHSLMGQLRYPSIDSFAPSSGKRGDTITIHGHFLTGASTVSFGTVAAASYTVISDSVISAVPGNGASGLVSVTTGYGSTNKGGFRFIYSSPIIRAFSPDSGATGDTIMVRGSYLTGTTTLHFGNVPAASWTVISDSLVVAVVGSGATGFVDLTTPGGADSLGGFVYIPKDTTVVPPPHDTIPPPDTVPPPPVVPPDSTGSGRATVFQLLDFTAAGHDGEVQLQWHTADDSIMAYYVVQYSSDSVNFDGIGSVKADRMDSASYSFTDVTHRTGASYYRLKIEDTASGMRYSPVLAVRSAGLAEMITVFPNPANDAFTAVVPSTVNNSGFELVDMTGRIVIVEPVKAGVSQVSFVVRALNRGVYKLIWTDGVNKAFRTLLIIRR
jgi:hypothetical protein